MSLGGPGLTTASEFYVTSTPAPNPDCPTDKPCHIFDEYAVHSDKYFQNVSAITLVFLEGGHSLVSTDFVLMNKVQVKMISINSVASIGFQYPLSPRIVLINITELYWSDISFEWSLVAKHSTSILVSEVVYCNVNNVYGALGKFKFYNVHTAELNNSKFTSSSITFNCSKSMEKIFETELKPVSLRLSNCEISSLLVDFQNVAAISIFTNTVMISGARFGQSGPRFMLSRSSLDLWVRGGMMSTLFRVFSIDLYFSDLLLSVQNVTITGNYENVIYLDAVASYFNVLVEYCHVEMNTAKFMKVDSQSLDNANVSTIRMNGLLVINNNHVIEPLIEIIGYIATEIQNCLFVNNDNTPFKQTFGSVSLRGNNTFSNNNGHTGGALCLVYSQLYLNNNSHTVFSDNVAYTFGGALFLQSLENAVFPRPCFYQLSIADKLQISVNFSNNHAELGGDHIFGAALYDTCVAGTHNNGTYVKSFQIVEKIFNIEKYLIQMTL